MKIIICPGVHSPALTQAFVQGLQLPASQGEPLIFPGDLEPSYSPLHVFQFLQRHLGDRPLDPIAQTPLLFIGFSAGVVGTIGAAWAWQQWGGRVKAVIALDGWGVPIGGGFPVHRLSHDYFTHWSSALMGTGEENFYADHPVPHLDLWRSPQNTHGWRVGGATSLTRKTLTAASFLSDLLKRYQQGS